MNSRGCITHTTVSVGVAGRYSEPPVAAWSAVRSTTLVVTVPAGTSRGFQSVFRKPAVAWAALDWLVMDRIARRRS